MLTRTKHRNYIKLRCEAGGFLAIKFIKEYHQRIIKNSQKDNLKTTESNEGSNEGILWLSHHRSSEDQKAAEFNILFYRF